MNRKRKNKLFNKPIGEKIEKKKEKKESESEWKILALRTKLKATNKTLRNKPLMLYTRGLVVKAGAELTPSM